MNKRQGGVKVTPQMIEAGLRAYFELKSDDDAFFGCSDEKKTEGIAAIYLAMEGARKKYE